MFKKPEDQTKKYISIMIIGAPGVGKTRLASTAPMPLIVDIDQGATTTGVMRFEPSMDVAGYDKTVAMLEGVAKLRPQENGALEYMTMIDGEQYSFQFKTVVIDTISTMQDMLGVKTPRDPRNKWSYYTTLKTAMEHVIYTIRRTNASNIVVCHSSLQNTGEEQAGEQIPFSTLRLVGAMRTQMLGYFDVILHLVQKNDSTISLITKETVIEGVRYLAKDRYNLFGGKTFPITFTHDGKPDPAILEKVFAICSGGDRQEVINMMIRETKKAWMAAAMKKKIVLSAGHKEGKVLLRTILGETYKELDAQIDASIVETLRLTGEEKIANYERKEG